MKHLPACLAIVAPPRLSSPGGKAPPTIPPYSAANTHPPATYGTRSTVLPAPASFFLLLPQGSMHIRIAADLSGPITASSPCSTATPRRNLAPKGHQGTTTQVATLLAPPMELLTRYTTTDIPSLRWLGRVIHCTLLFYILPLPYYHSTRTSIAVLPFYTHFHCRTSILHTLPLPYFHSTRTSITVLPFYTHFHCRTSVGYVTQLWNIEC